MDYILSWEKFDEIKTFLIEELTKHGAEFITEWDQPNLPLESVELKYNNVQFHLFLSCRKEDKFGFGISRVPDMHNIVNESIPYDTHYKDKVLSYIKQMG